MAEFKFSMPFGKIRELFDNSLNPEYKPNDKEFDDFMQFLGRNETPEEMMRGIILDFWSEKY